MAQASSAPITQKPATVALKPSPLTHGLTEIISTAIARSATSNGHRRRRRSAYAQMAKAVQATIATTSTIPAVGWTKLSRR